MPNDDDPPSTRCIFTINQARSHLFEMADPGDRVELHEHLDDGRFSGRVIVARVLDVLGGRVKR